MSTTSAMRTILMTLVTFAIVFVAYRGARVASDHGSFPAGPDPAAPVDDGPVTPAPRVPVGDAREERSPEGRRYTLPEALQSMPLPSRSTVLGLTIRDAGFECGEVLSAHEGADAAWRVACRDAMAYLVTVDAIGRLVVEPLSYGEGAPNVIPRPAPILPER